MTDLGDPAPDELLVGFANVLRAAGMSVTRPDQRLCQAVALTGFDDRASTYWSGRATLCSSLDDNELYDRAFTAWFADSPECRVQQAACRHDESRKHPWTPSPDSDGQSIESYLRTREHDGVTAPPRRGNPQRAGADSVGDALRQP